VHDGGHRPRGRPRTRVVHPWWEGATAWVTVRPDSPKVRHVERTPWTSLTDWDPAHAVVTAECPARPVPGRAERRRVWDAIAGDEPPDGFDPAAISPGGPDSADFGLLRMDAWRIGLAGAHGDPPPAPLVWHRGAGRAPPRARWRGRPAAGLSSPPCPAADWTPPSWSGASSRAGPAPRPP